MNWAGCCFQICNHVSPNIEHSWTYSSKLGITQSLGSAPPNHSDIQGQGCRIAQGFVFWPNSLPFFMQQTFTGTEPRTGLWIILSNLLLEKKLHCLNFNKLTDISRMCRHLVNCWLFFPDPNIKKKLKIWILIKQLSLVWVGLHDLHTILST